MALLRLQTVKISSISASTITGQRNYQPVAERSFINQYLKLFIMLAIQFATEKKTAYSSSVAAINYKTSNCGHNHIDYKCQWVTVHG